MVIIYAKQFAYSVHEYAYGYAYECTWDFKKVGFVIVRKKQWTDSPFFCKLQRMIKTFVAGWQLWALSCVCTHNWANWSV